MSAGDEIFVDPTVTGDVRDRFTRIGQELADLEEPLHRQARRVGEGAGEFADELATGLAAFELSWRAAFGASSRTSGNLAANIGGVTLDLQAVDLDLTI